MADKADTNIDNRAQREQDTRATTARAPTTFVPSGLLPEINKDPGYEYRWVRVSSNGVSDGPNMSARLREGWTPVSAKEQPGIIQFPDPKSRFKGMIEHGGLLLCKISKEFVEARRKYFSDKARAQIEGVNNNFMRENDRRMPLFRESKSEVKNSG